MPSQPTFPDANAVRAIQLEKLNRVLNAATRRPFYGSRLAGVRLPIESLDQLAELPVLGKEDMMPTRRGLPGRIFDDDPDGYVRMHQTSGSRGFPMPIRDTSADWEWWMECWRYVLDAAEVDRADVAMMAFSFGPFIGFWSANDALVRRGALVVPGGGMSSESRLRMIMDHRCTVLCCTPTYALHLAGLAQQKSIAIDQSDVRVIIVAGEPGGSVSAVREAIESAWGATVMDHSGASEVGAWGFGDTTGAGLHVIETEFIAELLRFDGRNPRGVSVGEGEEAELVLTNLGRLGGPAIRYRTGDIVRGYRQHDRRCPFLWLNGGVIGRSDDMVIVRGVNIFPSSIEAVVREVAGTAEYRATVDRHGQMDRLELELESDQQTAGRLAEQLQSRLAIRVPVKTVPPDTLPRFEAKAKRWIDRRRQ